MDEANYADLQLMMAGDDTGTELRMMRSYDPALAHLAEPHQDLSVPDPYYGGPEDFVEVLHMIEKAADGIGDGLLAGRLGS
jgi:protein-tyrosine phosphatase